MEVELNGWWWRAAGSGRPGGGGSVLCGFGCGEIVAGTELGSTRGTNMAGKGRDVNVEAINIIVRRHRHLELILSPFTITLVVNYSYCNGNADEDI